MTAWFQHVDLPEFRHILDHAVSQAQADDGNPVETFAGVSVDRGVFGPEIWRSRGWIAWRKHGWWWRLIC